MKGKFRYVLASVVALVLAGQGLARAQDAMPAAYPPAPNLPVFRQEELDQMLAPIALYPDALLAQVLMAATYPLEVVEAARWIKQYPGLTGPQLEAAVQNQPWDPSVKSLTAFPSVLAMLDQDLQWTQRLGDAFLAQREQVMDTVQQLRRRAYAAGTLATTPQQQVIVQPQYIYVEPAYVDTVYVPVYDPWIVYGSWWSPAYPPVYFAPPRGAVFVAGFFWGFHFAVHHALWGGCDWRHRDVTIVVNNYNYFSRTRIVSTHWEHDGHHRRGVPYRAAALEQRYGKIGNAHTIGQPGPHHADTKTIAPPVGRLDRGTGDLRGAPHRPDVPPGRPVPAAVTDPAGGTLGEHSDRGNAGIRGEQGKPEVHTNQPAPPIGTPPGGRFDRGINPNRNEANRGESVRTVSHVQNRDQTNIGQRNDNRSVNNATTVECVAAPQRPTNRGNAPADTNNGYLMNHGTGGAARAEQRGHGADREATKGRDQRTG